MRLAIHYRIAKQICADLRDLGGHLHEWSFLLGNLFPDLNQSYLWRRHEYRSAKGFIQKRLGALKRGPFFSFRLGIITHYICDFFCYPHSAVYGKSLLHHIRYELRQRFPRELALLPGEPRGGPFTIEALEAYIGRYEEERPLIEDDEHDSRMAARVSLDFLAAAC